MAVPDTDRFKTFFNHLETRKTLLTTITHLHKTLSQHFESLNQSHTENSQTLDTQIQSFQTLTNKTLETLLNRENAIPELESAAAARIHELRDAAVADISAAAAAAADGGEAAGEKGFSDLLKMYCRRMDAKGLVKLVLAKRKDALVLRAEIAKAVEESVDVRRLVVDAVEEFLEMKVEGKVGMADRRWACGMLIQAGLPLGGGGGVGTRLRERAAEVLERWKGVMDGVENNVGVGAGEATMFLHLVVSFGLRDRFDEEYLRKMVVEFATRRDMAKIAVALGFEDKMKDIIEGLLKSGKEIEAVYFASESGLTEQFPPVTLLRTCLRNCRKNANSISKTGKFSAAAVEEANNSELNTTKAIIKCVEDHKLESEFTIENLKQRVTQLEKAKADKKKAAGGSTSKPSSKRSHGGATRGSGSGSGGRTGGRPSSTSRPPKAARFSNASPSFLSRNPSQLQQAATAGRYYSGHTMYDIPGQASASIYAQGPASVSQQHAFAPLDIAPTTASRAGAGAGTAHGGPYGGQTGYSAYDYGAPAGPTYPTYPR